MVDTTIKPCAVPSHDFKTETSESSSFPRVNLLGGLTVRSGGAPYQLPIAAQRIVAFLALQQRPLPRSHVAGVLWTDSSEDRAAASLRSALWRVRLSGCSVVQATSQVVALTPDVTIDLRDAVLRAHRLLKWQQLEGSAPLSPDPREERLDWLALSSELLPGWYDDWVIIERERFNQLRVHALEAMSICLATAGRFGAAIDAGHLAIGVEPLRESAHRVVIRAHLAEGNLAEARHQYEFYRKLCRKELGCEPSGQMTAMLSDDPSSSRGPNRQVFFP